MFFISYDNDGIETARLQLYTLEYLGFPVTGITIVVVVDKSSDRFKELTTIGVASTSEEIAELEVKAQRWIDHYGGQQTFDFEESEKAMEEIRPTISMI